MGQVYWGQYPILPAPRFTGSSPPVASASVGGTSRGSPSGCGPSSHSGSSGHSILALGPEHCTWGRAHPPLCPPSSLLAAAAAAWAAAAVAVEEALLSRFRKGLSRSTP